MNRLKDISYAIALIISGLFLLYHLAMMPAHAQQKPSAPSESNRIIYMRGDTVFEMRADGVEVPLLPKTELDTDSEFKPLKLFSWPPLDSVQVFGWITDSIKWVPTDTTFEGEEDCKHEWVWSESYHQVGAFTHSDYHNGDHCSRNDMLREKICRACLRSIVEREKWFQHYVAPPKTEFERLKEKQRAKP